MKFFSRFIWGFLHTIFTLLYTTWCFVKFQSAGIWKHTTPKKLTDIFNKQIWILNEHESLSQGFPNGMFWLTQEEVGLNTPSLIYVFSCFFMGLGGSPLNKNIMKQMPMPFPFTCGNDTRHVLTKQRSSTWMERIDSRLKPPSLAQMGWWFCQIGTQRPSFCWRCLNNIIVNDCKLSFTGFIWLFGLLVGEIWWLWPMVFTKGCRKPTHRCGSWKGNRNIHKL